MQFSRGHLLGDTAVANGYADEFDVVWTVMRAEAAIAVNDAVIMATTVGDADDLGYSATISATADSGLVLGRAMDGAAAGETLRVQCYGVGLLKTESGAIATGDAVSTSGTTAGRVDDASDATTAGLAERNLGVFAIALEADGAAGSTSKYLIRCM